MTTRRNSNGNSSRSNSRRSRKQRSNFFVWLFGLTSVMMVSVLAFGAFMRILLVDTSASVVQWQDVGQAHSLEYQPIQPVQWVEDITLVPMHTRYVNDTRYLQLINREHAVSAVPENLSPVWPAVPVSMIHGMYLHDTALRAVEKMLEAAGDRGSLFVTSGFRCPDEQKVLYNGGLNSSFVLPPGHSEHHTGLAVDIMAMGVGQWELANSVQGRWLADNSYRYGLILRYPQGAEHITGITFEPWHFRYIGRSHAYFMRQNNLVLEEYIEMLQQQGGLSFDRNGITYYILHQVPQNGMIYVPDGLAFTISSDNLGGYIISAW